MTFWHKPLQKLNIWVAKRTLRSMALDLHVLQDDAYLYPLDVQEKTLRRLCRGHEAVSECLAWLSDKPDLPEDITALYVMWSRIDQALTVDYEKDLAPKHWVRICGCGEAFKIREIVKKKLEDQQTGDEECSSAQ